MSEQGDLQREFADTLTDFLAWVKDQKHALFTRSQINEALERAEKNPEDWPND